MVEKTFTVDYDGELKQVLEIDPTLFAVKKLYDWDGYLYLKEVSGNDVDYEIRSVVADIENVESSGTISANDVTTFTLSKTVRHRIYLKSNDGSSEGQVKVGLRINYYT